MVKLSELKKKWEEQTRQEEEEQHKLVELTIVDCATGLSNITCYSTEKRIPLVIPRTVEKAGELLSLIEEGKMVKVKVRMYSWSDRVNEIDEVRPLADDEIEVDGEFYVAPGPYGGLIARANGGVMVVIKPGTINYKRLTELYESGVDVVALKLSAVQVNNSAGRVKTVGLWIYPLKETEKEITQTQEQEQAEQKEEKQEQTQKVKPEELKQQEEQGQEQQEQAGQEEKVVLKLHG